MGRGKEGIRNPQQAHQVFMSGEELKSILCQQAQPKSQLLFSAPPRLECSWVDRSSGQITSQPSSLPIPSTLPVLCSSNFNSSPCSTRLFPAAMDLVGLLATTLFKVVPCIYYMWPESYVHLISASSFVNSLRADHILYFSGIPHGT